MTFQEMQPYLTAGTAILSAASLGFILNLMRDVRQNAKDRTDVMKDRLDGVHEELERTEKWSERERTRLQEEMDRLKSQLDAALSKEGLTPESLALGSDLREATAEARAQIQALVSEMQGKLAEFRSAKVGTSEPAWGLAIARGEMATGRPSVAAKLFDKYPDDEEPTWEQFLMRGVAHANSRGGDEANFAALRAYNDALAFAPITLQPQLKSRLLAYRGAMLKRLGRLDEAEADLQLAARLAPTTRERHDALYNLAGVYALSGDRARMLDVVRTLKDDKSRMTAIRYHLNDYFAAYANDQEFLTIIQSR